MTLMETVDAPFDQQAAEAFSAQLMETINAGAVTVMVSLGHRLGLFDVMAGGMPAASADIAAKAGLSERYVREWLASMVTGRIVDYDAATGRYALPPERAACLVRGAPLGNSAVYAQVPTIMGAIQDQIMACFRTGDGTRYDDYPCFHQFMSEDTEQTVVAGLFEHILPLAPDLEARLDRGIDVMDAGCGSGGALVALAARFPASRFTGYDLCPDALANGEAAAWQAGVSNVAFQVRDLTGYDESERFDLITSFDAIHDQKHPQQLVRGIHGALRDGGVYLVQDIGGSARLENNMDFPMAAMLYAISCNHCMPISLGQGGEGLGTMWGWETAERMLREAGFRSVERSVLPHDPLNVWFVARK
ncbi:MAG: methyltransferase domain-containing protein [Alphaproteobacteria bacterium]|nr:methyltransferase domain-containing protein [Alphaproteobacteria bacterium]